MEVYWKTQMKFHKKEVEVTSTFMNKQESGLKSKEVLLMAKEVIHIKTSRRGDGFQATQKL